METENVINILVADTSENSTETVLTLLEKQGYTLKSQRIGRKAELSEALGRQQWDVMLLNDELTEFSSAECLDWLTRLESHTALLLLTSRDIDIQFQTKASLAGISGLVSLQLPEHLQAVFARELQAVKIRQQRAQLLRDNQELVERNRQLLNTSREAVCYIHQGMHIYANDSYIQRFGFKDMDDVSSMPFIDLIGSKSREKLKACLKEVEDQWEEGQKKKQLLVDIVACKNTGGEFNAQLSLEPTLFEGEKCLQVFVSTEKENQKKLSQAVRLDFESGLFNRQFFLKQFEHLLQSIGKAKVAGGMLLYVRLNLNDQIRSKLGFEKSNQELKRFTSLLKQGMSRNNVIARFGDSDFIVMLAGDCSSPALQKEVADWQTKLEQYRFANDAELKADAITACHLISLEINKQTRSIKDVLTSVYRALNDRESESKAKPATRRDRITASKSKSLSEMGSIKIELESRAGEQEPAVTIEALESAAPAEKKAGQDSLEAGPEATPENTKPGPGNNEQISLKPDDLTQIINAGKIKLRYEMVIAVADIETEFNEVGVVLDDQRYAHISSKDIYSLLDRHPSGNKFDRLVLDKTLQVMVDLHKQGQTQHFGVTLSGNSLKDDRLIPWISAQMKKFKLDPASLILHIQQSTALSDVTVCVNFMSELRELGMQSCISHFIYNDSINNLIKKRKPDYIKLADETSAGIASDEEQQSDLEELTENFHDEAIKVIAGQVNDASTLSAYWVCNVDLVQGKYFQKESVELNPAAFADSNFAALGKIA